MMDDYKLELFLGIGAMFGVFPHEIHELDKSTDNFINAFPSRDAFFGFRRFYDNWPKPVRDLESVLQSCFWVFKKTERRRRISIGRSII